MLRLPALPTWLGQWRQWFNPIPFAAFVLVLITGWYMVFGDQGLLMLRQLRITQAELLNAEQAGVHRLHQLSEESERLKDPAYLEPIIRRDLGYVKPGEVVYQFPESD